jgi:Co/Zn/Cd efflux system component
MNSRKKRLPNKSDTNVTGENSLGVLRLDGIGSDYRRVLWVVIAITGSMFVIETAAGHWCSSQVLQADALDFLSDMLTYSLSLAVVGASTKKRVTAGLFKAALLCLMGFLLFASSVYHAFAPELPRADIMGAMGLFGLAVNAFCQRLLARHQGREHVIRTLAQSPQNDVVGNVAIVLAAIFVWTLQSAWPDLIVAIVATASFTSAEFKELRRLAKSINRFKSEK